MVDTIFMNGPLKTIDNWVDTEFAVNGLEGFLFEFIETLTSTKELRDQLSSVESVMEIIDAVSRVKDTQSKWWGQKIITILKERWDSMQNNCKPCLE